MAAAGFQLSKRVPSGAARIPCHAMPPREGSCAATHLLSGGARCNARYHSSHISAVLPAHIAGGWPKLQGSVCHGGVCQPAAAAALPTQGDRSGAADAWSRCMGSAAAKTAADV